MSIDVHTVDCINGSNFNRTDRVILGLLQSVANAAGGSAGASVTTAIAMDLPSTYSVFVSCAADVVADVTSKTSSGFNVVLEPRLASQTIGAGTFDLLIVG